MRKVCYGDHISYRKYSEMTDAVRYGKGKKEPQFLDLWMKKILLWQKKLKFCFHAKGGAYLKLLVTNAGVHERKGRIRDCMISFISRQNH
ncbi:MAG: hypothetical protein ACLTUL_08930 [Blautia faecis]